jgi:glycosyltransferase involved in cell wall biosynthesis
MIKIVSCFCNVEKYIKRCILSITKQKFENYEVYLIDDMSSDQTVNIINELIVHNPKFKLIVNTEKKFNFRFNNFNYYLIITLDNKDFALRNVE